MKAKEAKEEIKQGMMYGNSTEIALIRLVQSMKDLDSIREKYPPYLIEMEILESLENDQQIIK